MLAAWKKRARRVIAHIAAALGLLGQLDHPQVVEAIEQVIAEAHQAGISVGVPMDSKPPDVLLQWVSRGCRFVFAGEDHSFLCRTGTQTLMEFRRHLSE
jgi:4-hydroxy-2-oxoheptanedioate aldolase